MAVPSTEEKPDLELRGELSEQGHGAGAAERHSADDLQADKVNVRHISLFSGEVCHSHHRESQCVPQRWACFLLRDEVFKSVSLQMVQEMALESPEAVEELASVAREYLSRGLQNDLHARRVLFYCLLQSDPGEAVEALPKRRFCYVARWCRRLWRGIPTTSPCSSSPSALVGSHSLGRNRLASWLDRQLKLGGPAAEAARASLGRLLKLWEPYLVRNRRNQKAMWILNKFHRALGREAVADAYFNRLVQLHERGIDR